MYQLAHIANTVLYRANKFGMQITQMKLQKLIYFLYGEYLLETGEALFAERFEAWKYGPVLDDVYQAFKQYAAKAIKKYMPDANGKIMVVDLDTDYTLLACMNRVWDRYSEKTGIELSAVTHEKKSAWYKAASRGNTFLKDDDILAEMGMRDIAARA